MGTTFATQIPLRACEPWCQGGDGGEGHPLEHPDDRTCWSTFLTVPQSIHAPMEVTTDLENRQWARPWMNVYLRRPRQAPEPQIWLHTDEHDREVRLTLVEAAQLRDGLNELLAVAAEAPPTEQPAARTIR